MRIILINGPPRSGKDTAGKLLLDMFETGRIMKLAVPLKDRTHGAYELRCWHGTFEHCKDEPRGEFMGLTPRQAYIAFAEKFLKPVHGQGILGELLAKRIHELEAAGAYVNPAIITDSGFREEAEALVEEFGASSVVLLRMIRPGYTYVDDSRGVVDLTDLGVQCFDIDNSGTVEDLRQALRLLVTT